MAPERGLVMGEVFAPCDLLGASARLDLASLLAVSGRVLAVLPAELAQLPVQRAIRLEVRDAIIGGLGAAAIDRLSGWRLREVLPAMTGVDGAFCPPGTPLRLQGAIERNGAATWARLGDLTLAEIGTWAGVGARTAIDLIGVVVVSLLDRSESVPSRPKSPDALADLALLAGCWSTVKLVDIYGALTVLPGAARDYAKQEFSRDLYLLDHSGKTTVSDGRVMHLPASALTRNSGVLTTVARSGQEKVYAGISFEGQGR